MTAARPAAESWQLVDEILARPTAPPVAGQLAAFDVDVESDVYEPAPAPGADGLQLGLFGL